MFPKSKVIRLYANDYLLWKRFRKVAKDLTDKGYCSTKKLYYFGVKLHTLALRREKTVPFPEEILITPASVNDLTVLKEALQTKKQVFFGDKIYHHLERYLVVISK